MKLTEIDFGEAKPIEGYGADYFRLDGTAHPAPVVIAPGQVVAWGGIGDLETLKPLAGQVDVLFIGMGPDVAHLPPEFRKALDEAGVPAEVMASPAACRTYNVLLSEGRRVAVALLPVGETKA
ncbi:Mth938-like domain-containing protein [Pararhodobacter sp. CCB-MM2]|uniref:Mth938-like domain-containing protein n=1 Tax=Pararhodobacter sp. CCB-MM2 TaxID=1786003 RepID=UPI000830EB87|nr:Mth938-like domain-containing protein [Pararhodobacter sp. CCB-MM2]MCA2013371.1 Mth938-like domain-containing protein [Cereibacter sphaeroides]